MVVRQNGQFRRQKLKEVLPEKYEVSREDTPYQPYTVCQLSLPFSLSPSHPSSLSVFVSLSLSHPPSLSPPLTPPEEVQFKTGQDSIELKVPVEDDEDHKPAHA